MTDMTAMTDRAWRAALRVAWWALRAWWFIRRPHIQGVYVAVWYRDRLLIIRNSYKSYSTVPGGGVNRGEPRAMAAARELREEVGLQLSPESLRPAMDEVLYFEHKHDHVTVYEVETDREQEPHIDWREVVTASYFTREEALAIPLSPVVRRYLERRTRRPGTKNAAC